ncbi:MAG: GHKL domain-containing protein [Candidatus Faecousia sp.]|nr:GHKL domain-containing protein [Candidatus Faecousia sp.]
MGGKIIGAVLYWSWILYLLANGFFLYRIVSAFVQIKEKRICKGILFLLLCGTSGMVIWVGDNNLILTLPVFVTLYLICTKGELLGRLATVIVFFCLIMSVCAIADTYITVDWNHYEFAAALTKLAAFGLLYAALRRRLPREPVRLSQRLWKLVLGLSAMPFCALVAVVLLTYQKYDSPEVYAISMNQGLVILPFVLITSIVILSAILTLADYELLTREKRLTSLREVYYQGIQREQTQVRTLRHDLRNHLTVLQDLIANGEKEKAEDYVKQILGSPALKGSWQLCGNVTANAVLAAKAEEMTRLGLDGDIRVSLPEKLPVADVDLCALLGNALDNAMEAAAKAGDKKISVRCRADKGMLMLKVTNALAGDEQENLATTKADKKRHGFGLAGMREIAQRYGGTLEATADGGCFVLLVCLPLGGEM